MCCVTWTLVLSNRAERALGRMAAGDRRRIAEALLSMEQGPLSGDVTPLKGPHRGSYRRRGGAFRIIFMLNPDSAVAAVADIVRRTSTTY
jgi:mRNA-degrading endonuclease RelE of RelBE toxin-antitoxin system